MEIPFPLAARVQGLSYISCVRPFVGLGVVEQHEARLTYITVRFSRFVGDRVTHTLVQSATHDGARLTRYRRSTPPRDTPITPPPHTHMSARSTILSSRCVMGGQLATL